MKAKYVCEMCKSYIRAIVYKCEKCGRNICAFCKVIDTNKNVCRDCNGDSGTNTN